MRLQYLCSAAGLFWLSAATAAAQITLNPNPSRSVGHPHLAITTTSPNLVEGRELNGPRGIAVDTNASPPILYVSDTFNNRVLAWRNAAQFSNGAPADLIIGQRDQYTTLPQGPGTANTTGLNSPVGLAVKDGNLYVVDAGNNRVLRFPAPFSQSEQFPDLVIGQPGLTTRTANTGGVTSRSLAFTTGSANNPTIFQAFLAFDGQGNLWVADPVNRRVLRYLASDLRGGNHGPAADRVLGQPNFETPAAGNPPNQLTLDRFYVPSGVAFDPGGRLYVSDTNTSHADRVGRVLVFVPPFVSGVPARRVMGVVTQVQGQPPPTQEIADRTILLNPEGLFMIGDRPAVVEARSSRIMVFDPFDQWPPDTLAAPSPQATAVIGQGAFDSRRANRGQAEPSPGSLRFPVAATVAGGELFVADTENHRVLVFPQSGLDGAAGVRVLGQDRFFTNAPNLIEGREFQFLGDAGMVVDQTSDPPHLYVADTYNHRILGFRDARKLRPGDRADLVIGQPDMLRGVCNYPNNDSNRPTQSSLCGPTGVALDAAGNLWVADRGNGRALRFPRPFAQAGAAMPQADVVLGQADFTSKITDPTERTMSAPYGIAVEGNNGVLVSDAAHNRVLFFPRATDGSFTSGMAATKVFGQTGFSCPASGCPSTAMNAPRHIAVDTDGRLYVADTENNRVLIFGQLVNAPSVGALPVVTLTPSPALRAPRGIFVSAQTGEIWVTDTNGNRSLRFPRFEALLTNNASNATIPAPSPATLTQDQFGNLYVADGSNRVAIYYPGVAALNAANFLVGRALAPGTIASLFSLGNRFGDQTAAFYDFPDPIPLRNELADIQVLVNEVPSPLYAVTPEQINFVVPFSAPSSGTADVQVVRKSTGQILGSGLLQMNAASPALLTVNASGSGQVYVLNQDGTQNSPSNPAPRGSTIALFGTGQGTVPGAPADGQPPQGLVTTPEMPRVIIGTNFVPDENVTFSGLAPNWVALWQINVTIPDIVAPGNAVVVALLYRGIPSNDPQRVRTTIAVGP